jgi:hypothetical protein
MVEFKAQITAADKGGAYVVVPDEVVASLGGKGRIPVHATFDDVAYQGSVVSMGGQKVLGVLKAIRDEIGKGPGDTVAISVVADDEPRSVDVPDDLAEALREAGLDGTFGRLSYSHQREYVLWIGEAKKPETRARRIGQTVQRLQERGPYDGA